MKTVLVSVLVSSLLLAAVGPAFAHCEIPCGIYGDDARFAAIAEDLETVRKSMEMIVSLSAAPGENANQLVRWVNNKETHADRIRQVLTDYFMAQRVKTPDEADAAATERYRQQLVVLHKMIVATMKCKQTTDVSYVKQLHDLSHRFQTLYSGK